jgi:predicted  nucleic acid-binding Zn-ribbon protein
MSRAVIGGGGYLVPWNQFFVLQELDSQIDHLREELNLASLLGDQMTAHLDSEIARARRDESATQEQLRLRQEQRAEAAAIIPAPALAHYERLRARLKSRPWVVSLHGPICPACNIPLPSNRLADAQRTGEPVACPLCARLLIWRRLESKG